MTALSTCCSRQIRHLLLRKHTFASCRHCRYTSGICAQGRVCWAEGTEGRKEGNKQIPYRHISALNLKDAAAGNDQPQDEQSFHGDALR
jgi:hypothetical protein